MTLNANALNGFAGAVQVTLAGLAAGITSNPVSPFSVQAGSSVQVFFGAASSTPVGNIIVSAQATGAGISHSASLTLAVQPGIVQTLPRTTYRRTDAVAALDDPPTEPHHRHLVYDAPGKRIFVANRAMNRVEVLSASDGTMVGQANVSGASSADISADGKTIWVATVTGQVAAIDIGTLSVRSLSTVPAVQPLPNITFDRPEEALPLSTGKLFLRIRQASAAQSLLALWDPVSNALTNLTSAAPALFQNGAGPMARTGDHSKVLVAANDLSGEIALFDGNGAVAVGPVTLGSGAILRVVANQDGTRFAVIFSTGGITQVKLLDGSLNPVGSYVASNPLGAVFSRDSQQLFVTEAISGAPLLTVLSGTDLHLAGRVPDAAIQTGRSEIEDADETQMVFGLANRGVSLIDAAHPGALSAMAPSFAAAPVAQPAEGPNAGGTTVILNGQNFESSAQVTFDGQISGGVQVNGTTQIQAVSPASTAIGPVNVTAYFPSGWLALSPDAFSYGPQIREILPITGSKSGGDTISIYGYGFGSDPGSVSVKIGGAAGIVQKVDSVPAFSSSLGFDANFPFPLERITVQTPAGTPGVPDVIVSSAAGTVTQTRGFQYLQNVQVFSKPGFYKFLLYDHTRQWLYLSTIDHADVFDLNVAQFRTPIQPPGGPPPNAQLRGLGLTPDGSQLAIADFGAQSVYLLNPDSGTGTATSVGGVPGFQNSGPARVVATNAQTVFVAFSAVGSNGGCSTCLAQMNLSSSPPGIQPAPQPQVSALTGTPLLQSSADGSRVFLAFGSAPGAPLASWDSSTPDQFATSLANAGATDLATAGDGTLFALQQSNGSEIRTPSMGVGGVLASPELESIPFRTDVPGMALHPTGALLYRPFLTGPPPASLPIVGVQGGVDIVDTHTGQLRTRIMLPEPFAMLAADSDGLHGSFLAIDENGQRIFALTASGLTIAQLANVPPSIGSVNPGIGPAAGGTPVTIRGSGFQSAIALTIGGKTAAATFKDMNTLTFVTPPLTPGAQQIVLTNPNGETYALDAAFVAQ